MPAPFLNFRVNQPIHVSRDGSGGMEALLEVRNLLAEGYRPYILSDGSLLLFAARSAQRARRPRIHFLVSDSLISYQSHALEEFGAFCFCSRNLGSAWLSERHCHKLTRSMREIQLQFAREIGQNCKAAFPGSKPLFPIHRSEFKNGNAGGQNEQCAGACGNAQGRVRSQLRRQAQKLDGERAVFRRLGDLPHERLAGGSQPHLRLADQRLVRAADPALGRRRQNLASAGTAE